MCGQLLDSKGVGKRIGKKRAPIALCTIGAIGDNLFWDSLGSVSPTLAISAPSIEHAVFVHIRLNHAKLKILVAQKGLEPR